MFTREGWHGGGLGQVITANYTFPANENRRIFLFKSSTVNLTIVMPSIFGKTNGWPRFVIINSEDSTQSIHVQRFPGGAGKLIRTVGIGRAMVLGSAEPTAETDWISSLFNLGTP